MDDVKIVELYLQRDENAILHTAEKYGKRLQSLSFGIVGDRLTAEECENDTYSEAWCSIPPSKPKNYFYAFLCRIVRNISLDRCRQRTALKRKAHISELSLELENCIPSPDDCQQRIEDMAFAEILNRFLEGLSRDKRKIFVRRYFFLDSVEDIARRFSVSESKVKTTLFRVRSELKNYLIKEGYEL
ncbi:MAG: RNA polymerase sigma factor [Clostridia bacterium]|nr:RNA polymerase sigma factor [Clostridia bacterium]